MKCWMIRAVTSSAESQDWLNVDWWWLSSSSSCNGREGTERLMGRPASQRTVSDPDPWPIYCTVIFRELPHTNFHPSGSDTRLMWRVSVGPLYCISLAGNTSLWSILFFIIWNLQKDNLHRPYRSETSNCPWPYKPAADN